MNITDALPGWRLVREPRKESVVSAEPVLRRPLRLYLSGPMSGLPEHNYPAFAAATAKLRALGYDVFNPAETDDGDTSRPWAYYMKQDIVAVVGAEAVATLPGWRKSKGACLEVTIARALGLPILHADTLEPDDETILQEAQRLVYGDRQATYGHPFDDFTRTGRLWAPILGMEEVTPEQVALCMNQVKVSRLCATPGHHDSMVDGPGYFATYALVRERRVSAGNGHDHKPDTSTLHGQPRLVDAP